MSDDKFQNTYRTQTTRASWHAYDGGIYFVTICVNDRTHVFGDIYRKPGETWNTIEYTTLGNYAKQIIENTHQHESYADILLYTVMPNHIHILLRIDNANTTKTQNTFGPQAQNLASVIRCIKSSITKFAHENNIPFLWQSRFYDHIVRNFEDLNRISEYIKNNVDKWDSDSLNEANATK